VHDFNSSFSNHSYHFHSYRFALELPHLPDMVFHKNTLVLEHESGATISFSPLDSLKKVRNEKLDLRVSCSDEWRESRPKDKTKEKLKPFDWTFSTDYQGNMNDKFTVEKTDKRIDKFKLMVKENILFYADLTLFEDELHDNGTSVSSVKIVSIQQRLMVTAHANFFAFFSGSCRRVFMFSFGSSCELTTC
jgi:type 2A phosphatase activator TIP41